MKNLSGRPLPPALLKQFVAKQYERIRDGEVGSTPGDIVSDRIREVLLDYTTACGWQAPIPFMPGTR
jgi:D-tagatose-1,6-bisphosphate aldolase subunit GatZ/KbaZ